MVRVHPVLGGSWMSSHHQELCEVVRCRVEVLQDEAGWWRQLSDNRHVFYTAGQST